LLLENEEYGVYMSSSSKTNLIHHNNFVDNNPTGTSQAYDGGKHNIWYDSLNLEGNYWSDWNGTGSYSIDGYGGTVDLYPLEEPSDFEIPETTETTETTETNDNNNGCTSIIPFTQWFAVLGLAVIGLINIIRKEKKKKSI